MPPRLFAATQPTTAAAMSSNPTAAAVVGTEEDSKRVVHRKRKDNFRHMERVDGRMVNVLQGLELHTGVFSPGEQQQIVECVQQLQEQGRRGLLLGGARSYSEPRKWMRGKGRATIQFGCCYNYATDRRGNPPGIIRDEVVDPLPPVLKCMVRRLVHWRVLPPSCVPDTCIVNIYDVGDCIPPHIDHHDFVRPFCTVSFLAECRILFGRDIRVMGPGEVAGPGEVSLPVGSVLVLNGNAADVAKHCVPAVPTKRISITFRKMDQAKRPFNFTPDPDLVAPLPHAPAPRVRQATTSTTSPMMSPQQLQQQQQQQRASNKSVAAATTAAQTMFSLSSDEFPALGALSKPATRGRQ